jgi:hypothetical protein
MTRTLLFSLAALAAGPLVGPAGAAPAPRKPKVEVVFCLDTTGSMGGLIEGAKQKIWSVCNQIAGGRPLPDLKVGLVAYRDRGDAYVTKVFDLSDDLDAVHGHLKGFVAAGGGDAPESVNQALHDAVHKVSWGTNKKTLKIIFLVGDAPPHMDYKDDVKYPETCKKAAEKGILINAIQCGADPACAKAWKDIAAKAGGSFAAVPQAGGVVVVSTPHDAKLAELNKELAKTVLVWGNRKQQAAGLEKNAAAAALRPDGAAARVAFQAKNAQAAAYDLLDSIKRGKVKLEDLKKDELPEPLRKLTVKEQKEYLSKLEKKRAELNRQVLRLDRKRTEFIARKRAEDAKKNGSSFDAEVLESLRRQARKFDIAY